MTNTTRRTVLNAAWVTPVVAISSAAPATAASCPQKLPVVVGVCRLDSHNHKAHNHKAHNHKGQKYLDVVFSEKVTVDSVLVGKFPARFQTVSSIAILVGELKLKGNPVLTITLSSGQVITYSTRPLKDCNAK